MLLRVTAVAKRRGASVAAMSATADARASIYPYLSPKFGSKRRIIGPDNSRRRCEPSPNEERYDHTAEDMIADGRWRC